MFTRFRSRLARLQNAPYRVILPVLAGLTLLGAGFLPWLNDPLGASFSAWQLPIDLGWQVRFSGFNYGTLCSICALYAWYIALLGWRSCGEQRRNLSASRLHCTIAGLLCLLPMVLFLTQYLYVDMGSVAQFTRHETQAMMIKAHFGYGVAAQFIPIQLPTFDPLTIHSRLALLLDQLNVGLYVPLIGLLLLLNARRTFPNTGQAVPGHRRRIVWFAIAGALLCILTLGRGPAGMASNVQAEHLLAEGDYADALKWLDTALWLNPSLDQLSGYHLERGHAWYFLHPNLPNSESRAYLGVFYRQQNDYLSSYQELLTAWQNSTPAPWLQDELNTTLMRLAEMPHPLHGSPVLRIDLEQPSLTWLSEITQDDPTNAYAHYMIGRIRYDMHDFSGCAVQMLSVLRLAQENNILSSAYTYLGLSSAGQGDAVTARQYLFKAQDLDPEFRNNTDREEISGLR